MLFYLADSLLVDKKSSEYFEIATAISNIAIAAFESKHSISGDIGILEFMSKNIDIDIRARMVLNNVVQQYATQPIPQFITFYLEVVKECEENSFRKDGNRIIAQMSYKEFLDTKSTQECCLIGEYYYDCKFFRRILSWFKGKNGITLPTVFEDIDGGGDDTYKKVKQFVGRNKRPTLCIVDSDRRYPEQTIVENSTCGKCMRLFPNIPIYRFIALNVQEVENLVPLSVIDDLSWGGDAKYQKDSYDYLRKATNSSELLAFFDIKKGIRYYQSLFMDSKYVDFVKKCCLCHPNIEIPKDYSSLKEGTIIYPSLRKDLLKDSLDLISKKGITSYDLMNFQEKEWATIAEQMLNWGFCRNKESVS